METIVFFVRGWSDATEFDDILQHVGVNKDTLAIVDTEELVFEGDLPDTSHCRTFEDLQCSFEMKGWRLQ